MKPEIIIKDNRGDGHKKRQVVSQPLRVICLSFALVILVGTILLLPAHFLQIPGVYTAGEQHVHRYLGHLCDRTDHL